MIVCLSGMHRSGTSLVSSYLQHCGINMGETLAGAGAGNKYGHFEDREFLELHKQILKANHVHMYRVRKHLMVTEEQRQIARRLLQRNNELYRVWGWKDPRTTLLLDLWIELTPVSKYIFLYRDPVAVIDSLFRRRGERFLYIQPLLAADAWILYNERILDFYSRFPEKCLVVNINGLNCAPELSMPKIGNWLGYALNKPYSEVYHPKGISTSMSAPTKCFYPLIKRFRGAQLSKIFEQLERIAAIPSPASINSDQAP